MQGCKAEQSTVCQTSTCSKTTDLLPLDDHVMSRPCSIAWGLLGGQLCNGTVLDSSTSTGVHSGWDPPTIDTTSFTQLLTLTGATGNTEVQQFALGWQHALLLLANGTGYLTDAAAWRSWCAGSAYRYLLIPNSDY